MKRGVMIAVLAGLLPVSGMADEMDYLDLDNLMQMDVQAITALKRASSVRETAASIYVLDKEELSAFGVDTVPEALKLVPGLFVRQIDGNLWAISTRFVASQFYSRMLVMVDGQNVYNPTFAGIAWEELDIDIGTIERIEVIRGTGGMLWGANATNGVVNIITKQSFDTQGWRVKAGYSSKNSGLFTSRYGTSLGSKTFFRVGLSGHAHEESSEPSDANDAGSLGSASVRVDHAWSDYVNWQLHLRYVDSNIDQNMIDSSLQPAAALAETIDGKSFSFMSRIEQTLSASATQQFQVSYQYSFRPQRAIDVKYQSWDLDYQINKSWDNMRLDFGAYIRYNDVLSGDGALIKVSDRDKSLDIYGMFLQYEWEISDKTRLLLAGKVDHNKYHRWQFQPSVRGLHTFNDQHSVWFGVSEVTRTPTFGEYAISIQGASVPIGNLVQTGNPNVDNLPISVSIYGNNELEPDRATNFELGYRFRYSDRTFVDLNGYYAKYDNSVNFTENVDFAALEQAIRLAMLGDVASAEAILADNEISIISQGGGKLDIYGIEANMEHQFSDRFRLQLAATWLDLKHQGRRGEIYSLGVSDDIVQVKAKARYRWSESFALSTAVNYETASDLYQTDGRVSATLGGTYNYGSDIEFGLFLKNMFSDDYEYERTADIYVIPSKVEPYVMGTVRMEF